MIILRNPEISSNQAAAVLVVRLGGSLLWTVGRAWITLLSSSICLVNPFNQLLILINNDNSFNPFYSFCGFFLIIINNNNILQGLMASA